MVDVVDDVADVGENDVEVEYDDYDVLAAAVVGVVDEERNDAAVDPAIVVAVDVAAAAVHFLRMIYSYHQMEMMMHLNSSDCDQCQEHQCY